MVHTLSSIALHHYYSAQFMVGIQQMLGLIHYFIVFSTLQCVSQLFLHSILIPPSELGGEDLVIPIWQKRKLRHTD